MSKENNEKAIQDLKLRATSELNLHLLTSRPESTDHLKQVAECVVDIRELSLNKVGKKDWRGGSPQYKAVIREIMNQNHIDEEDRYNLRCSLKYHVNNRLFALAEEGDKLTEQGLPGARLTTAELEEAGFKPKSARERSKESKRSAAKSSAVFSQSVISGDQPILTATEEVSGLLSKMDVESVENTGLLINALSGIVNQLKEIQEKAGQLAREGSIV